MDKIESREFLENLIQTYQNLVFSICYKITKDYFAAEDLTQETFLSAYRHYDTFDGKNEKAWIGRIATNKSIDYLNQAGRRMIPTEDIAFEERKSKLGRPEEEMMEQDFKVRLLKNCGELKPPYDEVARMFFYEEKKPAEIAQILGKSIKTIQTQIYRARDALRKKYEKERCCK